MGALKYTIGFVKTCNLEMLCLIFGERAATTTLLTCSKRSPTWYKRRKFKTFNFFIFKSIIYTLLWCNYFSFLWNLHSYDVNWSSIILHYDRRSSWVFFMIKCENEYFRIRENYFCGLLDCAFISMESKK
jgi:hypothetical protein